MTTLLRILTVTVVLLSLSGCGKPIEQAIIGRWGEKGKEEQFIEFFSDNTFLMKAEAQHSGKWTKVGDNRIKMDMTVLFIPVSLFLEDIKISGNQLAYTLEGKKYQATRTR